MPSVLFVHNGSPGRFASLSRALLAKGWHGALVNGPEGRDLAGMRTVRWRLARSPPRSSFGFVHRPERDLVNGRAAVEAARQLKSQGFRPDVIVGHPAWGEMLFLDEVFPDVPQIQIGELYYLSRNSDIDFDPEFPATLEARVFARAKNLGLAASYLNAARIVCPTRFQADTLPAPLHARISVIHEGIDTAVARRQTGVALRVADAVTLDGSTPVVTFVNRHFEPMRGFHVFMRALPRLLRELPTAHVLMIGSDAPEGYGRPPPKGTWREMMMEEVGRGIDTARVHFVGQIGYAQLLKVLSISTAHVYLTYPFVLSWSLLDAMACECVVIGSDTAPVREVVAHGENGLLADFFDPDGLAQTVIEVCRHPGRYAELRAAARRTVIERFDRATVCEPAWMELVDRVVRSPAASGSGEETAA